MDEMASSKLAFLFKKRISVLLDLTLNDIDNLIKVKNKRTLKAPIQQLKKANDFGGKKVCNIINFES